ncbi:MAG: EamA family transporter [Bacteroidetes bacterium]|nr:EamA family transporter [Bacteroidota bacterium]
MFFGLVSFGFAPILVRFGTDVEPLVLAALRTAFAVALLMPFWMSKGLSVKNLKKNGVHLLWLIGAGICLGLHFTLWIASLHYTSVASASVLVTIHPVILIIVESLLFKRSFFRPLVWTGVFVAFGGSAFLGIADKTLAEQFPNALLGNSLAFSAAMIFVIYFLIGRKIRQHSEWIDYVFHVYLYAAITCIVLSFIWIGGMPVVTASSIVVGLALAIGPTILGHGSMNYAVKYVSPTLLSTLILSEAVFAAIAAYFIFGEIPSLLSITAMVTIICGVSLTWSKRLKRQNK